jgi:hypothetical protein
MLLANALLLGLLWLGLDLLGARAGVGVLSGTVVGDGLTALLAMLYVLGWFLAVLVAPVLAIAGGLQLVAAWLNGRHVRI